MLSQLPSVSTLHAASAWGSWALMITGFSMPSPCRQGNCRKCNNCREIFFFFSPFTSFWKQAPLTFYTLRRLFASLPCTASVAQQWQQKEFGTYIDLCRGGSKDPEVTAPSSTSSGTSRTVAGCSTTLPEILCPSSQRKLRAVLS